MKFIAGPKLQAHGSQYLGLYSLKLNAELYVADLPSKKLKTRSAALFRLRT